MNIETNSENDFDRQMLSHAIFLAKKGKYTVEQNPLVGCVIVKDGKIVAEGWHKKAGQAHAEIDALNNLADINLAKGATAYVSLEPCCHTGKTGPCTQALINAGIKRVVCAMQDPAVHVAGKGFKALVESGIYVHCGLLENEAQQLNKGFIKRMTTSLPFVRLKMAMSIDGRTALNNGESKWITGEAARKDVHRYRAQSGAIVTGIETVLADNPKMTARIDEQNLAQPLRVVVDSLFRIPKDALIFSDDNLCKVATCINKGDWHIDADKNKRVDLKSLLHKLAEEQVNEVWVEAGATLAGAFVENDLVDELVIYMAPVLLGDKARPLFELPELTKMQERKKLSLIDSRKVGDDTRLIFTFEENN
jgi:diaminohydroxyphosphoribosylaminopyrimidine deaminase/5-amino-6-(5-phosphoribosylamino)uracil reductase